MALDFNTTLREEPVTIDGRGYVLRELTGAARERYGTLQLRSTEEGEDGDTRLLSLVGLETELVALSLFTSTGEAVDLATVERWPGRVVTALADAARKLSALTEEEQGNS